jgi:hypothetical protein
MVCKSFIREKRSSDECQLRCPIFQSHTWIQKGYNSFQEQREVQKLSDVAHCWTKLTIFLCNHLFSWDVWSLVLILISYRTTNHQSRGVLLHLPRFGRDQWFQYVSRSTIFSREHGNRGRPPLTLEFEDSLAVWQQLSATEIPVGISISW